MKKRMTDMVLILAMVVSVCHVSVFAEDTVANTNDTVKATVVEEAKIAIPFTDVEGHQAYSDIAWAYGKKIFSGTSATKFSPDDTVTTGMFLTVLGRMAEADISSYQTKATDVYYAPYIAWATEKGIVEGVIVPETNISREQMATAMYNCFGKPEVSGMVLKEFDDGDKISVFAQNGMLWAVQKGIITGKTQVLLDPQGLSTRGEVSAVLKRLAEAK